MIESFSYYTSQSLLADIIRFCQEFLIFLLTEGIHLAILVILCTLRQDLLQSAFHKEYFLFILKT